MYPHNLLPEGWPVEVHLYGVLIAVGILAAFAILIYYGRKLSVSEKMIDFVFQNADVEEIIQKDSAQDTEPAETEE